MRRTRPKQKPQTGFNSYLIRDIIDDENSVSISIVTRCNGPESFLSGRIPLKTDDDKDFFQLALYKFHITLHQMYLWL